jgi:hypothetical protein
MGTTKTTTTTTTDATTSTAVALVISSVALAGWNMASTKADAISAIQAAGGMDQANVKAEFYAGYVAYRLAAPGTSISRDAIAAAVAVLAKANTNAKGADVAKRDETEERAYGAARSAWKSLLAKAQVKTTEARGGNRAQRNEAVAGKATTERADKAASAKAAVITVASPAGLLAALRQGASIAAATVDVNKRFANTAMREAVQAFNAALAKIDLGE